jgi:hypothetical protein
MTENSARKQRGKPFRKGQSGNPAGKPKGARHRMTVAAESLLDGEAEALTRKVIELAKEGDTIALRLCLERILPPRKDRHVAFDLPKIESPAEAVIASAAILGAVADGNLTPSEAGEIFKLIEGFLKTLELTEIEERLRRLEGRAGA